MPKSIPEGWHSVTPRLVVHDPPALIRFIKQTFGASGEIAVDAPSLITIGDSILMVSGAGPHDPMPAFLYVYVDDAVATYHRALEAGAVSLETPRDLPYGDTRAMVRDAFGNVWQIANRKA